MPASRMPVYFQQMITQDLSLTTPVGKMGDRTVLPLMDKLSQVRSQEASQEACLKTSKNHNWVRGVLGSMTNISNGVEKIASYKLQIGASSFISLSAGVGIGVGIAGAYDHYKEYNRAKDIKDETGQKLAVLGGVESGILAVGAGTVLGLKSFSAVQDVGLAMHHPIVFTGSIAAAQGALSWASGIVFGLYYVVNGIRSALDLISWYQGRKWRQELLQTKDPAQTLYRQLRERTYQIDMTAEEEIDLALKAGAQWLDKVESASDGKLKIKDKKEAFEKLVMEHPEIIRNLIGNCREKLTPRGELIRFGKYMAYQNECAKFEAECTRKLGSKAVEAMKAGDKTALNEALKFKEWVGLAVKVGLAVIGLAAVVAMTILLTGSPIGVLLILAGIAALAMIFISDGQALKAHLQSGEFKKRDRAFVYFTLALSMISFAGVVALTIATGGMAPFLVSLVLSAAWLGINAYSAYALWRYDNRGWEVQKVVDLVTYRKFLETKPAEANVSQIKKKMTQEDQDYVDNLENPLEDLKQRESHLQQLHEEQLDQLVKALSIDSRPPPSVDYGDGERDRGLSSLPRIRKRT